MLKILYVHDHVIKKNNRKYYSEGKLTDEVFNRYVRHEDDKIYVLSRMEELSNVNGLTEIRSKKILFNPVLGLKLFQIYIFYFCRNVNLICILLKKVDFLIIRMPSFLGIMVFLLNFFFKRKLFIEFVGDPEESLNSILKDNIFNKALIQFIVFINRMVLFSADGVIYVTKFFLQKKYPTNAYHEYASNVEIDVELMNLTIDDYRFLANTCRVGLIGSFNNSYKGIDIAMDAIASLKEKNIIAELHILGSGVLQENYELYSRELGILDQVYFDGRLSSKKEINEWLDNLDIYVQPSRTEGLPRALIEAMSRGLPAVASNVGGIPELLDPNFIVESNNSSMLSYKLYSLILSQQLRFEQGFRNYEISKNYDLKVLNRRRKRFWDYARNLVCE